MSDSTGCSVIFQDVVIYTSIRKAYRLFDSLASGAVIKRLVSYFIDGEKER